MLAFVLLIGLGFDFVLLSVMILFLVCCGF